MLNEMKLIENLVVPIYIALPTEKLWSEVPAWKFDVRVVVRVATDAHLSCNFTSLNEMSAALAVITDGEMRRHNTKA